MVISMFIFRDIEDIIVSRRGSLKCYLPIGVGKIKQILLYNLCYFKVPSANVRKLSSIRCRIEALILHHFFVCNICLMFHNNSFSIGNNFAFLVRLWSSVFQFLSSKKKKHFPYLFNFCTCHV